MSKAPTSKYSRVYASIVNDVKNPSLATEATTKRLKITANNSNAKILSGLLSPYQSSAQSVAHVKNALKRNAGLNSEQLRFNMVEWLKSEKKITDERVLQAVMQVPRHYFMDPGFASRAYHDEALPIGYGQTISKPSVVARMISIVLEGRDPSNVLEIGTGCGYQAAVLACIFKQVYSIERIQGLYDLALKNLNGLVGLPRVEVNYGDGRLGWSSAAPFDAIILAAAGMQVPQTLLEQLKIGGRLIAPEGADQQKLVLFERITMDKWSRQDLETTRFVPLRTGVQF